MLPRYHPMNMSTGYYQYGDYHRGGTGAGAHAEASMMDSSYGPASMMSSLSYSHSFSQYPSQASATAAVHRTQVYTPSGGHLQQPSLYSQSDFSDSRCFVISIIFIINQHIITPNQYSNQSIHPPNPVHYYLLHPSFLGRLTSARPMSYTCRGRCPRWERRK